MGTDTRSVTPIMNHGGFISSVDIVNAAGERLEFMTSNPLTAPYSVAFPTASLHVGGLDLNYNSGSNHCLNPPRGVCNVDQREECDLPDNAVWVWMEQQRRQSMEFEFNEIEDELIAHGCINADYKNKDELFAAGLLIVAAFYFYNRSISKQLLEFNDETV